MKLTLIANKNAYLVTSISNLINLQSHTIPILAHNDKNVITMLIAQVTV